MTAYLCLVTWPDGSEGLLFPRPGNVPIAQTIEDGERDFDIACEHLRQLVKQNPELKAAKLRLDKFQRVLTWQTYQVSETAES